MTQSYGYKCLGCNTVKIQGFVWTHTKDPCHDGYIFIVLVSTFHSSSLHQLPPYLAVPSATITACLRQTTIPLHSFHLVSILLWAEKSEEHIC